MSDTDNIVEVVDTHADRPAFSNRGDSGVVLPPLDDPLDHLDIHVTPRRDPIAEIEAMTDEELLAEAGVEPIFSTSEAAEFFDRSNQWLYWGLREGVFVDGEGKPILPDWIGDSNRGRRRFTLPIIKEIAKSSYRRGNFTLEQLKTVMLRARYAELGVEWREREGWRHVGMGRKRYRWVHPDKARYNNKTSQWEMKPEVRAKGQDDG